MLIKKEKSLSSIFLHLIFYNFLSPFHVQEQHTRTNMWPDNYPAYTNGVKNPTKRSLVLIKRNLDVERALVDYQSRNSPKISLRNVVKTEKKEMKPSTSQEAYGSVFEAPENHNVTQLRQRYAKLKEETDAFLQSELPIIDEEMLQSDDPPNFDPSIFDLPTVDDPIDKSCVGPTSSPALAPKVDLDHVMESDLDLDKSCVEPTSSSALLAPKVDLDHVMESDLDLDKSCVKPTSSSALVRKVDLDYVMESDIPLVKSYVGPTSSSTLAPKVDLDHVMESDRPVDKSCVGPTSSSTSVPKVDLDYVIPSTFPTSFEIQQPGVSSSVDPCHGSSDATSAGRIIVFKPRKSKVVESPSDPNANLSSNVAPTPSLSSNDQVAQCNSELPDAPSQAREVDPANPPGSSLEKTLQEAVERARKIVTQYELMVLLVEKIKKDNANADANANANANADAEEKVLSSS